MQTRRFELEPNERVLFESRPGVVTNQRLLANWKGRGGGRPKNRIPLGDIDGYERVVGGQESQMDRGFAMLGGGGLAILIALIPGLPDRLEALVFFVGMVIGIFGVHFLIQSLVRLRPHTTLLFEVGAKVVPVSFPGRENPEADELIRHFNQAKAGD